MRVYTGSLRSTCLPYKIGNKMKHKHQRRKCLFKWCLSQILSCPAFVILRLNRGKWCLNDHSGFHSFISRQSNNQNENNKTGKAPIVQINNNKKRCMKQGTLYIYHYCTRSGNM